ncbi:hypothetical protein L208DRAFT_1394595 [Tricholoma matsutake]|nr:hypothetical protein L208DRAFT_1395383 [Tricholoma matsutake 945]KAF8234106.1 hypothetical protein L208DRAFT_1394595 [Tricholoma matsutake 945]
MKSENESKWFDARVEGWAEGIRAENQLINVPLSRYNLAVSGDSRKICPRSKEEIAR